MAENIDFDEIELNEDPDLNQQFEASLNIQEEIKESDVKADTKQVKKPQTAFAIYIQETRLKIQEEMKKDGVKQTQFLSEASKRWNALDAEAKQKYIEIAQKQKDAYNQMKAQMPSANADGDGEVPEEEENQLRSKNRQKFNELCREIHVVAHESRQTDMPIRSRRLYTSQ